MTGLPDWRRMLKYVFVRIQTHPGLDPIRAAGRHVSVQGHTAAIWLAARPRKDGGGYEIKVRHEEPEWWLPLKRSRGDQLVDELAGGMRARWEEQPW